MKYLASLSEEILNDVHASLEVNLPNYAGAILTTDEIVAANRFPRRPGSHCRVVI